MNPELILTEDGSHSLYLPELNETYHSKKGAIQESQYVFIEQGFNFFLQSTSSKSVRILEIGFGTGLNAYLTYLACNNTGVNCEFTTLEPSPLNSELIEKLNYPILLSENDESWERLHTCDWEQKNKLSEHFTLTKINTQLEKFLSSNRFDVIYFDAFAPSKQAAIWKIDNLKKCFELLEIGGILVTYCAQGEFKRNLKKVGFKLEVLPGPPGKHEMVRGIKM